MRYPGGKGKTYQHIINLMPVHGVYIETHLGGGAVLRNKRPAERSIALDADPAVIAKWQSLAPRAGLELVCTRAESFLEKYPFEGDELIYVDPPYHPDTRRRERVYRYDYVDADHEKLLALLKKLPCCVIVSGYANPLYADELSDWLTRTFSAKTHTDVREETLWFNYEPPLVLHDSRYLGGGFRQRQSTKRRMERLKDKFRSMDPVERSALAQWLYESYPAPIGSNSP